MTTQTEALKMAFEAAYLAGFNASGEGYNGEYPFGDKMQDPAENRVWKKDRDNYIKEALANHIVDATKMVVQQSPQRSEDPNNEQVELECYDAGLLSSFGGGDVDWWQDYIRAELGRAHDFYQSQVETHPPVPYVVEPRTAQPKEQKQRPFTKKQRDTLCTVYAIASASTTANSLPNIAKIVNELLTEDLEVQPKAPEQEPVARVVKQGATVKLEWVNADSAHNAKVVNLYTTPPTQQSCSQRQCNVKPLMDEMVLAGARALAKRHADSCGLDFDDVWKYYAEEHKIDAKAVIEAAHGIRPTDFKE